MKRALVPPCVEWPRVAARRGSPRGTRATLVGLLLLAPLAAPAQPTCRVRPEMLNNDGGWMGDSSNIECDFSATTPAALVEARLTGTAYGAPGLTKVLTPAVDAYFPLQHLGVYELRARGLFPDGGAATPQSLEWTVTADRVAPTLPGPLAVMDIDGGTFRVVFAASTDDGEGRVTYETSVMLDGQGGPGIETGRSSFAVPEVLYDLGPGTWVLSLASLDVVRNYGGLRKTPPFTIDADPSLTPPSAPVPTRALFDTASVSVTVAEPADVWHFVGVELDGGLFAGPINRSSPNGAAPFVASGYLPRECVFRVRGSRLVGGKASAWSAPSSAFKVDLVAPTDPPLVSAGEDGGAVVLAWSSSTDSCSGVSHYRIERSGGAGWVPLGANVTGVQVVDTPPQPGLWRYRVLAVDVAGHQSGFTEAAPVAWGLGGGADGGATAVDGGMTAPDGGAGPTDAGSEGPGPTKGLRVGCDCSSGSGLFLAALALLLVRRAPRPVPRAGVGRADRWALRPLCPGPGARRADLRASRHSGHRRGRDELHTQLETLENGL